jgi:hypothetical protein
MGSPFLFRTPDFSGWGYFMSKEMELTISVDKFRRVMGKTTNDVKDAIRARAMARHASMAWSQIETDYTTPEFRERMTGRN